MASANILSVCPACSGDGVNKGLTCGLCAGTGKVIDRELDISALKTQLDALEAKLDEILAHPWW